MNKFNLTVDTNNLADQIAALINSGQQLRYYLTRQSILNGRIQYIIEMDREKVIGAMALEQQNAKVTEMKFLCVHPNYRRQGLGRKLLETGVKNATTEFVYGAVRSDNEVNIRNNLRIGMRPVGKYRGRGCYIIVFARRRTNNVRYSIYRRGA